VRIWVIGSDPVARALGRSWVRTAHEVLFTFGFDGTDFDALAAETGGRVGTLAEGATAVDAGFVPVDAGRLEVARDVEAPGRLLVDIAYRRGPRAGRLPVAHAG
jgi:hypothetical protein